jgi:hypothetical protein
MRQENAYHYTLSARQEKEKSDAHVNFDPPTFVLIIKLRSGEESSEAAQRSFMKMAPKSDW